MCCEHLLQDLSGVVGCCLWHVTQTSGQLLNSSTTIKKCFFPHSPKLMCIVSQWVDRCCQECQNAPSGMAAVAQLVLQCVASFSMSMCYQTKFLADTFILPTPTWPLSSSVNSWPCNFLRITTHSFPHNICCERSIPLAFYKRASCLLWLALHTVPDISSETPLPTSCPCVSVHSSWDLACTQSCTSIYALKRSSHLCILAAASGRTPCWCLSIFQRGQ